MSPKLGYQRKLGTDVNQLVVIKIKHFQKRIFPKFYLVQAKG